MKTVLDSYPAGRFLAVFLLALALLVAGCGGPVEEKQDGPDNGSGGAAEGDKDPVQPGPPLTGTQQSIDSNNPSLKEKFGVTAEGQPGITATFNALSKFLKDGLVPVNVVIGGIATHHPIDVPVTLNDYIRLGDWIDLEDGLAVAEYEGAGAFSYNAATAMQDMTYNSEPWGKRCRLIVVGINSFRDGGHDGTSSYIYQEMDETPPHVVFQFQNIPVTRRMNPGESNVGGYEASEMRKYLTPVAGFTESGNFLAGLHNAGVPETVLWAPARAVSTSPDAIATIKDTLWLPTERELFGNGDDAGNHYSSDEETAGNQARLEYYTDNNSRIKLSGASATQGALYWEGSMPSSASYGTAFLHVCATGDAHYQTPGNGVAPAFCVW
jgi:hypothetical protein